MLGYTFHYFLDTFSSIKLRLFVYFRLLIDNLGLFVFRLKIIGLLRVLIWRTDDTFSDSFGVGLEYAYCKFLSRFNFNITFFIITSDYNFTPGFSELAWTQCISHIAQLWLEYPVIRKQFSWIKCIDIGRYGYCVLYSLQGCCSTVWWLERWWLGPIHHMLNLDHHWLDLRSVIVFQLQTQPRLLTIASFFSIPTAAKTEHLYNPQPVCNSFPAQLGCTYLISYSRIPSPIYSNFYPLTEELFQLGIRCF